MTQTNKPLVFPRLTPVLLPVVLLASVFMITACGGKKSGAVPGSRGPAPAFTSDVRDDVPPDIQSQIAVISAEANETVRDLRFLRLGSNYLRDISANIPLNSRVQTLTLKGENGGGGLDERAGFLMTFVADSTENYAHSVVGMFETTDVGAALDNTTSATFTGQYTLRFLAFPPATTEVKDPPPLSESITEQPITLNIKFNDKEIDADARFNGARLQIEGKFGGNRITDGKATFRPNGSSLDFEAPLIGLIGQDGAVGVFASHSRSGTRYSLGGGFVVEPPVAEPANNN